MTETTTVRLKCFCSRCGYSAFTPIEAKPIGNDDFVPLTNNPTKCPKCDLKAFRPLNMTTTHHAVSYLLNEMYTMKQANSSEAITFLANILDVK